MSLFVTRRMMNRQISFSTLASDAVIMNPVLTVSLPETQNSKGSFTCTGLTYDTAEDVMWGGYYGRTTPEDDSLQPALIKLDLDFHILDEISLENYAKRNERMSLQGITYDATDDSLWFTDSETVFEIDKNGQQLREFKVEGINPNGIVYDTASDTLWVLGYKRYLINLTKDGKVIKKVRCNYLDQDQLMIVDGAVYFTVGADYKGDQNYVGVVSVESGKVSCYAQLADSYAVEGCCVIEDKLYVFNDGFYHNCAIKENIVQVYDWSIVREGFSLLMGV